MIHTYTDQINQHYNNNTITNTTTTTTATNTATTITTIVTKPTLHKMLTNNYISYSSSDISSESSDSDYDKQKSFPIKPSKTLCIEEGLKPTPSVSNVGLYTHSKKSIEKKPMSILLKRRTSHYFGVAGLLYQVRLYCMVLCYLCVALSGN